MITAIRQLVTTSPTPRTSRKKGCEAPTRSADKAAPIIASKT